MQKKNTTLPRLTRVGKSRVLLRNYVQAIMFVHNSLLIRVD